MGPESMTTDSLQQFGAAIQQVIRGENLGREQTRQLFEQVLAAEQPDLQQGAFLGALAAKGETAAEIAGVWAAIDALDTCHVSSALPEVVENSGTGMDQLKTFNVSSAAALVAAAAGVPMARHGARALTSRCGTVDILEAVGIDVECPVEMVAHSIRQCGIGLFNGMSPEVHPMALGRILSQIRFGSVLNIAASLANPARPQRAVRGVWSAECMELVADVMQEIGYQRALIVYGHDAESGLGMDEISTCGVTDIIEFRGSHRSRYRITPEALGIERSRVSQIAATGDLATEAVRFLAVLAGQPRQQACIDLVCSNAAAVLYVAGKAASLAEGVRQSRALIHSGAALAKLRQWVAVQNRDNKLKAEICS